jgi:hypothetical protein
MLAVHIQMHLRWDQRVDVIYVCANFTPASL